MIHFSFLGFSHQPIDPYQIGSVRKVVIDAGHGGKDPGCHGHHSQEKHIALDIALLIGDKLQQHHPEIEVIYTRTSDVFIPLSKRIDIANKAQADLFVSIHCNYVKQGSAHGTETYVMGLHKLDENLEVARRENSAILLEDNYSDQYIGFDPNSIESLIILSMYQNAYLNQSIKLATKIETSFANHTLLHSRGVKQAGFVVLKEATMPSVLVEAGFLSNTEEEKYLRNTKGKEDVSDAIVNAISEYKRDIDVLLSNSMEHSTTSQHTAIPQSQNTIVEQPIVSETHTYQAPTPSPVQKGTSVPKNAKYKVVKSPTGATIIEFETPPEVVQNEPSSTVLKTANESIKEQVTSHEIEPNPAPVSSNAHSHTSTIQRHDVVSHSAEIIYRVQIAASKKSPIIDARSIFSKVGDLEIKQEDQLYKYLTGHFYNLNDAMQWKQNMSKDGFKGAFVVAYKGDQRVNL